LGHSESVFGLSFTSPKSLSKKIEASFLDDFILWAMPIPMQYLYDVVNGKIVWQKLTVVNWQKKL